MKVILGINKKYLAEEIPEGGTHHPRGWGARPLPRGPPGSPPMPIFCYMKSFPLEKIIIKLTGRNSAGALDWFRQGSASWRWCFVPKASSLFFLGRKTSYSRRWASEACQGPHDTTRKRLTSGAPVLPTNGALLVRH